jgi:hypothetical protein
VAILLSGRVLGKELLDPPDLGSTMTVDHDMFLEN